MAAQCLLVLQHYQAGSFLWLIPSYVERPGLESPWSRVVAVLRASSHGTGALGEFQPCPGEQCRDGFQHCWSWHSTTSSVLLSWHDRDLALHPIV